MKDAPPDRVRFGEFELDLQSGELRHGGTGVFLQDQPFKVLRILVEGDGRLVSREEIRKKLWPNDTIVEFNHSINVAIGNLRRKLGDSAEAPKFIQTVARRGYRFMVPVERIPDTDDSVEASSRLSGRGEMVSRRRSEAGGPLTGRTVSHYRVLDIIGGGGMGVVYRAEDLRLGRQVALKFLPEEMGSDPQALERFGREARAASSLDHPNICHIYEFGEHESQPFIVMQLLEGQTLRDRLAAVAERERLPVDELLDIGIQVSDGLRAAHEQGIIHRDIKPGNVFLTSNGSCKILDFGLVKLLEGVEEEEPESETETPPASASSAPATHLTCTGIAIGTAGYMSPEQIRGDNLDTRTDLFSFGLVLYEMATGRRAFEGETAAVVHEAIVNRTPTPASEFNSEIPPDLQAIIHKTLEKDRERRHQTAAELGSALRLLKIQAKATKNWSLSVAAPLVILMVGIGVSGLLWRRGTPQAELQELRITANPVGDRIIGGAISPDGKYVAYHDQTGLYLRSVESGETRSIAVPAELSRIFFLSWFPDGQKLLAEVNGQDGNDIWVIVLQGEAKPYLLYRHGMVPIISPDGQRIVFTSGAIGKDWKEVWVGDVTGDSPRKLAEVGDQQILASPAWSPDGRWVAYGKGWKSAEGSWSSTIEIRPATGGDAKTLLAESNMPKSIRFLPGANPLFSLSWSPDLRLVFSAVRGSETQTLYSLWQVAVNPRTVEADTEPQRLTQWSDSWPWNLIITADGKRLSLQKNRKWMDVYVGELGSGGASITAPRRFTVDDRGSNLNTWTPDGDSILFDSNRNGRSEIFRQGVNERVARVILTGSGDLANVDVTPDGLWYLYEQQSQGTSDVTGASPDTFWLTRSAVTGGAPTKLFTIAGGDDYWCASNPKAESPCVLGQLEGKNIVFYSLDPIRGRGRQLGKIEIMSPYWLRGWRVSPDGSTIALVDSHKYGRSIQLLTLADGSWRELPLDPEVGRLQSIAWTADGRAFFAISATKDALSLLRVTRSGKVQWLLPRLSPLNQFLQLPLASPDGKFVAFNAQTWDSNVWMIDKF